MRIGVCTVYSWRPHVEYMAIISDCLKSRGFEVFSLVCSSDLDFCHNIAALPSVPRFVHCAVCKGKNLNAYLSDNVESIGKNRKIVPQKLNLEHGDWGHSSASTIGRFESKEHFESKTFQESKQKFSAAAFTAFEAAVEWIKKHKIERILVFNGRIDATRGVLEAAKHLNVPFFTVERPPFGFGVLILPQESCLGLKTLRQKHDQWKHVSLDKSESERIGSLIAARILGKIKSEWRIYNQQAVHKEWPTQSDRHKILILPSSSNEINDAIDWACGWSDATNAFDALLDHFSMDPCQVVLRCHPNWSEKVYGAGGEKIERVFKKWAEERGVYLISSKDTASTRFLIAQSDVVVVNGGSSALEAVFLGKPVISTRPSNNYSKEFVIEAHDQNQLNKIEKCLNTVLVCHEKNKEELVRAALRYFYCFVFRYPVLVDAIRSPGVTNVICDINETDISALVNVIEGDKSLPSPLCSENNLTWENKLVESIMSGQFHRLLIHEMYGSKFKQRSARGIYKIVCFLRRFFDRGDQI